MTNSLMDRSSYCLPQRNNLDKFYSGVRPTLVVKIQKIFCQIYVVGGTAGLAAASLAIHNKVVSYYPP
jgi:hypothetical protein